MTARPVTTTDLWKLVGLVLVLIDHWGLLFADDPSWRVVGRAAAPIFFFFIGLARTRQVPWSWVILGLGLTAGRELDLGHWAREDQSQHPDQLRLCPPPLAGG